MEDTHYPNKITLDQLSSKFFINKFYLTRSFKDQFGLPVNSYLIQIRITHAKQLLRFTELSIEKNRSGMRHERRQLFFQNLKK